MGFPGGSDGKESALYKYLYIMYLYVKYLLNVSLHEALYRAIGHNAELNGSS